MYEYLFDSWLNDRGFFNQRVVSDNKSRCKRVEKELRIDLDEEYARDSLGTVLARLEYTAEDARHHVPVPLGLNVARPVKSLATLRTAIRNYRAFRQAGAIEGRAGNQRASFDDLKNAFGEWLKEDLGANTANSYKSYLNQLKKSFEQSFGEDSFNQLTESFQNRNAEEIGRQILLCQNFILRSKAGDLGHATDWSCRFSAFNRFVNYLEEFYDIDVIIERERIVHPVQPVRVLSAENVQEVQQNLAPLAFSLTPAELRRIFYSRLTTQSRSYLTNGDEGIGLIFPIRLINTIFRLGRDNRFKQLIENDISHISFLDEREHRCLFTDVHEVNFDGHGKVTVIENNGREFILYTKTFRENNQIIHIPLNAYTEATLSIDHITPMEHAMRLHRDELIALRRITDRFTEFNAGHHFLPNEDRVWKDALLAAHPELYTDDFRNLLMNDLNLIHVDYEIMDTRENSRRGNRA